jgi:PAS domain S-box-containing protein
MNEPASDSPADLEAVNATAELARRPSRPPDHAAENRALVALAQHIARSPKDILQKLAETALELCRADSAGISVLEEEDGRKVFRWHAVAGRFARLPWNALPGDASPCRTAIDRKEPMLFLLPGRHYASLSDLSPPIVEALLVPFALGGEAVGTAWVMTHEECRAFDGEDARILQSLAQFASAAHQTLSSLNALREAQRESQQLAAALRRRELEFRRLLDTLPVSAYTCDADGLITYHNQQAVRLWGREPKLHHPADRFCGSFRLYASDGSPLRHDECWMARALQEGETYEAQEILIERPDGSRVAALAHASPIRDAGGELIGAVNILVDISERKRTQDALEESEQRFVRFMQRLPGLAWIKDLQGRYLFVNDAAECAFRKPRAELLGRTDEEIFPPDTAAQFRANDARAVASGSGVEAIAALEHADGVHHSLVSKFPIPGADGRPSMIGGIAVDITERIRAEEALRTSEQIYRAIGESIDYGVWVCDADGRNVYASESFLKLVGLTQEQCSNLGWGDVLHPDDAERTLAAWQECVRTGRQWDVEHRYRGVDGRWHPVLARGVRIVNERGDTTAWAGINLDISRQKQVEEELREADRRKDEFLATLAHELRNPLAPIRNSLSVLRMAGGGSGAERVHEMMERQVDQMVRLVDDLLEVSRITRGKIELRHERVELEAVVRAAVETSRPLLEAARHRLELSLPAEPLILEADPVRLAQVFANLLNNAAKYTEAGGRIALAARRQGDEAVVSVRDDGIGIAAEQLPEVFDPFIQVDRTLGRAQGGLGIGLTLVRRLVQLHGGRVEAHSDGPGTGSEFRVTLPLASASARTAADQEAAPEPLAAVAAPRRILVVDDNHDAADSLGMLLRVLGVESQVAHDGVSALQAVGTFRPHMVLLDLGMPGMDGYEVARRVRERTAGDGALLIALTGWGQPEDRRRTREAGFDHHLVKPVDLGALQSLLALLDGPDED